MRQQGEIEAGEHEEACRNVGEPECRSVQSVEGWA